VFGFSFLENFSEFENKKVSQKEKLVREEKYKTY